MAPPTLMIAAAAAILLAASTGCSLLEPIEGEWSGAPDADSSIDASPSDTGPGADADAARDGGADACPSAAEACAALGACETMIEDGCGAMVACGACAGEDEVCGGGGEPGRCASAPMVVVASSSALCSDASQWIAQCPGPGEPGYGQEATSALPAPSLTPDGAGMRDDRTELIWSLDDRTSMSAAEAEQICGALKTDGLSWRLPTALELSSIIDPGREEPALYEPLGFARRGRYLTRDGTLTLNADTASFESSTNLQFTVRCVSGELAIPAPRFESSSAVALDRLTGLRWQRTENRETLDWLAALELCEGLILDGHDDWRLPTYKELLTIVVPRESGPSLDLAVFGSATEQSYWSATPQTPYLPGSAYAVNFDGGSSSEVPMDATLRARCVRRRASELAPVRP